MCIFYKEIKRMDFTNGDIFRLKNGCPLFDNVKIKGLKSATYIINNIVNDKILPQTFEIRTIEGLIFKITANVLAYYFIPIRLHNEPNYIDKYFLLESEIPDTITIMNEEYRYSERCIEDDPTGAVIFESGGSLIVGFPSDLIIGNVPMTQPTTITMNPPIQQQQPQFAQPIPPIMFPTTPSPLYQVPQTLSKLDEPRALDMILYNDTTYLISFISKSQTQFEQICSLESSIIQLPNLKLGMATIKAFREIGIPRQTESYRRVFNPCNNDLSASIGFDIVIKKLKELNDNQQKLKFKLFEDDQEREFQFNEDITTNLHKQYKSGVVVLFNPEYSNVLFHYRELEQFLGIEHK